MTDISGMTWHDHQEWENAWWAGCFNTMAEESKQIVYAHHMGLMNEPRDGMWPVYDLRGSSVLDIGGGPTSLLLKCVNGGRRMVVDPCRYPAWVNVRYESAGIEYEQYPAEDIDRFDPDNRLMFDEAWIYNVLQHVQDPEKIIRNARTRARRVRIFEWIDLPPCPGHPQELKEAELNAWLDGRGLVVDFRAEPINGCNWIAYTGIFRGLG